MPSEASPSSGANHAVSALALDHDTWIFGFDSALGSQNTVVGALKLVKRLVNIGDAKSLACHPASTTHRQMTRDEQRVAGVLPETIRLSVGIEHIDDILEDLDQALAAARPAALAA